MPLLSIQQWQGAGVGGEYRETLTRGDFALGTLKLPHEVVSYAGRAERGSESTQMQAGVIGESTLRRFDMTYDYGHKQVWIDSESKQSPTPFNRAGLRIQRDAPDSFIVASIVPGSPADTAGLKPGDRIFAVNSQPASKLAASDVYITCAGPIGTDVELVVASKEGGQSRRRSLRLVEVLP